MELKVKLNKAKSLQDSNKNTTLQVSLSNNKEPLVDDEIVDAVDEYAQYLNEREMCSKIRLTAQVNVVATNVLFNHITEVVKDEDKPNCQCLNFRGQTVDWTKKDIVWGDDISECVRDTQITSTIHEGWNCKYNVGLDILNNHILRSKTTYPLVRDDEDNEVCENFNTLKGLVVDMNGKKPLSCAFSSSTNTWLHMYRKQDLVNSRTFSEACNRLIEEKNGWYGFRNRSKMTSMDRDGNYLGVERVLNYEDANKFVEFYPNHTHFDLLPYYNKYRKRKEKNWEYCLCYPYSSTTENIPCISGEGRLKIVFIDENIVDDDDLIKTMIVSSCKHGLVAGDTISIYRNSEDGLSGETLVNEDVVVDSIVDEYTFYVYLTDNICNRWVDVMDDLQLSGTTNNKGVFEQCFPFINVYRRNGKNYHAYNGKINCDFDDNNHIGSQNLTFCRTINNEECKYYVRIFSRLPNFEFMDDEVTEESIYSEQETLNAKPVDYYANAQYEHQSVLSRLSYAKNVYNDNMHQIAYTDDIYFNNLHDNLGRPLTSLYLCFFKTNYGNKQWYSQNTTSASIEHSHCFGKVNCGLELSPDSVFYGFESGNTRAMNNVDSGRSGLDVSMLRIAPRPSLDSDEIDFKNMNLFYGDLCEYSLTEFTERTLQPILHRFNTKQRELSGCTNEIIQPFKKEIEYDKIQFDDYSLDVGATKYGYMIDTELFGDIGTSISQKEGYVYQSAYKIPLRVWGSQIKAFKPFELELYNIQNRENEYIISTLQPHRLNKDFKMVLYDTVKKKQYNCTISEITDTNSFTTVIEDFDLSADMSRYHLYKVPDSVPDYVTLSDGIYRWRYLYENGFEDTKGSVEEYPFTNNCFYVNTQINLYVRRQDPFGENGLSDENIPVLGGKESKWRRSGDMTVYKERDVLC